MASNELSEDPIELLHELRVIAPDLLESGKRCLILPQTLGDFYKQEYIDDIQDMLHKLNEYKGMLDDGLISEEDYESKKAEISLSIQGSKI